MTLLTGSQGYIGRRLQETTDLPLLTLDHQAGAMFSGKIGEIEKFREELKEVTAVFHLADKRFAEINSENMKENIQEHKSFLQTISGLPRLQNLIFASSCSVYGVQPAAADEDTSPNPTSFYAESKLHTEEAVRSSGVPYQILRFGTVFGPSPNFRHDLFIHQVIHAAVRAVPMEVFSPHHTRPYIHIDDYIRTLLFLKDETGKREILNCASVNLTKTAILEICKNVGLDDDWWRINEELSDPRNYAVSSERLINRGLVFKRSIEEDLHALVQYSQSQA